MQNNASSLPISYNFHVMLLLVNVMFASKFASNPVNQWFLIKIPTSQWRAVHSRISNGIIFAADTMITQLQNLWLLYYIYLRITAQFFLNRWTITDSIRSF